LFVVLNEQSKHASTPWTSLASRRFGGEFYERIVTLQDDNFTEESKVHVKSTSFGDQFDLIIVNSSGTMEFSNVPAKLLSPTVIQTTIDCKQSQTTIVTQSPPPGVPASKSLNATERLHVFSGGSKTTLILPSPKWLLSKGDVLNVAEGAVVKAPMPGLIVGVRVEAGQTVKKGQAIVVLESMKTETVLRADSDGVVSTVCCKEGDMVRESTVLVDIKVE
jgi:3-methylcrotonyl-CoA carboxylase alpha subunit